jgi:hypothetical protein
MSRHFGEKVKVDPRRIGSENKMEHHAYLRDRYSEAVDLVVRRINHEIYVEEQTSSCTEHVRGGKPLTATGAKLLGVEWPL